MEKNGSTITSGPAVWGGGQLLAFSGIDGPTSYRNGLTARTRFEGTGIDVVLPGRCVLHFSEARPDVTRLAGDHFGFAVPEGEVRGVFVDAYHLLIDGPCAATALEPVVRVATAGTRTLVGSAVAFDERLLAADLDAAYSARAAWLDRTFAGASARFGVRAAGEPPGAPAARTSATLAKACSQIKTMIYASEGTIRRRYSTPDRWPHRGMWLWDSAFHAIGIRRIDPGLAAELLEAVFDVQQPDGRVPLMGEPESVDRQFTQPPLLALAASLVEAADGGAERAAGPADGGAAGSVAGATGRADGAASGLTARLYERLAAYLEWDFANRDRDGDGLLEWAITDDVTCRSGESGMDNSPRWDRGVPMAAVDFNAMIAHECELMAGFARRLGRIDQAGTWDERHRTLCRLINERLWDEERGFYYDRNPAVTTADGALSDVAACSGFFPLICGAPTAQQATRLVEALVDPARFATPLPVPTISAQNAAFYQKDMWRGPVWMNVNWLVAYGLERYGYRDEAARIRRSSVAEIERHYARYGTIFEFYDDRKEIDPPLLLRKGECNPAKSPYRQVFFDYGWSATLYVDMLAELSAGR